MKNIPPKIYLQVDADGETPEDFKELNVSWAAERVYPNDIEYVLAPKIVSIDMSESEEIKYYIETMRENALQQMQEMIGIPENRQGVPHNNL